MSVCQVPGRKSSSELRERSRPLRRRSSSEMAVVTTDLIFFPDMVSARRCRIGRTRSAPGRRCPASPASASACGRPTSTAKGARQVSNCSP
jgi:hypothetical protein